MRRNRSNHPIDSPMKFFAQWGAQARFWFSGLLILLVIMVVTMALGATACFKSSPEVIIYAAQDQQFAEPILKEFQKQTGIKVRAVYDSEAVKTVALANRLLAESSHPRCDVWWSNEALRTRQLAAKGVFESNSIVEFGSRSRRIVVNTNKLASPPRSMLEL